MTFTVLIFVYRLPSLSFADFQTHYENTHVPLVKALLGSTWPYSHTRHYINRKSTPSPYLVGSPGDSDPDCMVVMEFADQEAMAKTFAFFQQPEIASQIADDEVKFMDKEKTKIVMVGEARTTTKD